MGVNVRHFHFQCGCVVQTHSSFFFFSCRQVIRDLHEENVFDRSTHTFTRHVIMEMFHFNSPEYFVYELLVARNILICLSRPRHQTVPEWRWCVCVSWAILIKVELNMETENHRCSLCADSRIRFLDIWRKQSNWTLRRNNFQFARWQTHVDYVLYFQRRFVRCKIHRWQPQKLVQNRMVETNRQNCSSQFTVIVLANCSHSTCAYNTRAIPHYIVWQSRCIDRMERTNGGKLNDINRGRVCGGYKAIFGHNNNQE